VEADCPQAGVQTVLASFFVSILGIERSP